MLLKTVNILGVEYKIIFANEDEKPKLKTLECDGYMDHSIKEIVVEKIEPDENSIDNLDEYKNKVLRHEIIHAFLYESGLWNNSGSPEAWGQDETITDWIAIQFPKMLKVFKELDCL